MSGRNPKRQEQRQIPEGDSEEIASRIARLTMPGKDNDGLVDTLEDAPEVLEEFLEMVNNWVEVIDFRVYRNNKIGIPCRYRWTIKRWVVNDTDQWLMDNGWEYLAHLKADSREHRENEMEARYRTNIQGYQVYANFYVEFTNDVFEAMKKGEPIPAGGANSQRREVLEEMREERRKV